MKRAVAFSTILALLLICHVPVRAGGDFDYEKERGKLWEWLADKHAGLGNDYKKYQLYSLARKQYDRARELEPDNRKAWQGLGYRKHGDKWVPDDPLPDKDGVAGKDFLEARKKPDEEKNKVWDKCADRCRKLMEKAQKAGDDRAAKIAAIDLLYYLPDDPDARKLRGHVKDGDAWVPPAVKQWRDEGRKVAEASGFGEELKGPDPQAVAIGSSFNCRQSDYLVVRTSYGMERAKLLHRNAEATIKRTMALLGRDAPPFKGNRYTITHLQSRTEYLGMIEKVLKLTGDDLEFAKKLNGHGQSKPRGFFCWSTSDASADDMLCNTVALNVMGYAQTGNSNRAAWIDTGFGYFVTSQVLGTTMVQRYTLKVQGMTSSDDKVEPEFTKKSGTPDLLREVALYNIRYNRDIPLRTLIATEINDMQQAHAAKAFSFMEFVYANYAKQAKKWMTGGGQKDTQARVKAIEDAFGKKLDDLENEWREWVLLNY